MFYIISSVFRDFLAIFLTGIVIKLMDDFLDRELDELQSKVTLAGTMGTGALPYALVFLIIGASLNRELCFSLFLASYGLGMYRDFKRPLLFGLNGWQEALLALLLTLALVGWKLAFWSFAGIWAIQLADDLIDYRLDRQSGHQTIIQSLGIVESCCFLTIVALICFFLNLRDSILLFVIAPLVAWLASETERGLRNDC